MSEYPTSKEPTMPVKTPITVAYGDGIGPEITAATLKILMAANAEIEPEIIEVGEKIYKEGFTSGIPLGNR
jgi:isocitrate dehydrogenase